MDTINSIIFKELTNKDPVEIQPINDVGIAEKKLETTDENKSANNSTENMESLLVEEDEEDYLGTESLLLSGSEAEKDDHISPVRQKKRAKKLIESDDDEGNEGPNTEKNEIALETKISEPEAMENEHVAYKPKRFTALIDSDSETELPETTALDKENVNSEHKKPTKFSALIDSDSEQESITEDLRSQMVNSEDEQNTKRKKDKKLKKTKKNTSANSESEGDPPIEKKKKKSKKSDIIDSDSESSNASDEPDEETNVNKASNEGTKKPQRASAKKAMDEMQAIQSETQRLHREAQVSIPYHKPKRHTLKEFLTRRTIAKPTLALGGSGKKLKMSPEELEEFAKHLEERAKEATEFFKSESDDEEMKDNMEENEPNEKEIATDAPTIQQVEQETTTETATLLNTEEIERLLQDDDMSSLPTTQDLLNIETQTTSVPLTPSVPPTNDSLKDPTEPMPSTSILKQSAIPNSLTELKLRLIAEKNIPAPTLKGDPNMIIDFETGDMFAPKPTGLDSLFQRFMKCNKNNKKKPVEALSQDVTSVLKVAVIEESNKEKEPKPGAAYIKLKENLRTLITKKRKEELKKKVEENQEEEDEYNKCCGLDDDDQDEEEEESRKRHEKKHQERKNHDIVIDEEENEVEYEDDEEEEEDQEQEENQDDNPENTNKIAVENENDLNENEDEEENEGDADSSDSDESEEEPQIDDPSTRKHRVIKAFEDSDDEEVTTGLNTTSTSVLFAEEENKNPEEVENELLGLCSGQFEESQRAPLISQIPVTQTQGNNAETELMDLCSGAFVNDPVEDQEEQVAVMRIVSSDEEKEPDKESSQVEEKKVKKLTKKKKRAKLCFSDDEEDKDEEVKNQSQDQEAENEEEEEIPQTYIDYDSEENEVEVQMTKKDFWKNADAFVEKEAELSESEWGSADEDEQNLDKYDMELGDEDEFDQNKIQTELGQIHMRKVLDEDIREVKRIQDMLFDNEENDGVGRQRQFRWKNVESGFSLDDPAGGGADNDEKVDSADDEEEMQWRKMRFEREQILKQKTKEEILEEVSKTTLGRNLLQTMKTDLKPEVKFTKEVLVEKEYKAPSFLIALRDTKSIKGSFLNYDKETLAKIAASITKSGDYTRDEQTQAKASKTGNFVFAPLSEEEQAMRKRKMEDENGNGNVSKKIKNNSKNSSKKSLLLDKLL